MAAVSCHPDPAIHAYRKDLADVALAGTVIASHYAEPLARRICSATDLRLEGSADSASVSRLAEGEAFRMLDCTRGWAWGYAADGRVGYVSEEAIGA